MFASTCDCCRRVVHLDAPPEPRQCVLCETCWEAEGEELAAAGVYAEEGV